jgi:hypothetical protein
VVFKPPKSTCIGSKQKQNNVKPYNRRERKRPRLESRKEAKSKKAM